MNAGHEDEDEDEDEDADAGSSLVTPVGRSGRALPPLPPVGGSGSDLALANEQHYGIGEAP